MPEFDYSTYSPFSYTEGLYLAKTIDTHAISNGEAVMKREDIQTTGYVTASQRLVLTHFTALKTETITKVAVFSGATAAAATPTLCRVGIYSVADNGDLSLVASTPNDTTLFSVTFSRNEKALSAPFNKEAGKRYAVGALVVSAAALPTFYGTQVGGFTTFTFREPKTCTLVNGQADLPASVANASLSSSNGPIYAELIV